MEAAALVLMASGMGVMFGWQPMSDGSSRYEYVVQLEPELVATLEEGQSIPISSDVPDDIRPIGRIRIVVGRQPLPRQQISTQLMPKLSQAEKKSREGVIETQFTVPPVQPSSGDRYGPTNSQEILPPGGGTDIANQRFAQALQNGSQAIGNGLSPILPPQEGQDGVGPIQDATQALGNQLRNIGDSVRTDAQQMFGASNNDNNTNPLDRLGNAVDRLRQGVQRGGEQVRNTVQDIGQRTQEAVDQFGRPLRELSILNGGQETRQSTAEGQVILPPAGGTPQQQAGNQFDPQRRRLDQPVDSQPRDNWQAPAWNGATTPTQSDSPNLKPRALNTPGPPTPREESQSQVAGNSLSPLQTASSPNDLPTSGNNAQDRYPTNTGSSLSQDGGGYRVTDSWSTGPIFPDNNSSQSFLPGADTRNPQTAGGSATNSNWPANSATTPEIRREMLDQPAGADLQTSNGQPATSPPPGYQPQASNQPQAADLGWDSHSRAATVPNQTGEGNKSLFPLLLSWVLLSGSGAGNLYLFWSYLDVRHKYRGVVHNARGGSRYRDLD